MVKGGVLLRKPPARCCPPSLHGANTVQHMQPDPDMPPLRRSPPPARLKIRPNATLRTACLPAGVYLDLDIECFTPMDPWLADYDVVLQVPVGQRGWL